MGLSDKEIDLLINKVREKYKESFIEYKSRLFNVEAFEDRLQTALRRRMNLEGFILAEIANFEQIKQRIDEERHPKNAGESAFSKQVNKIFEDNTAKIKKYNEIQFHPLADIEMTHLYGALSEFIQYYFSILWTILTDYQQKDKLHALDDRFSDFALSKSRRHPKRIEDHISVIARKNAKEIEIEKDKNEYLKESAFLLHEVIDFMDDLISIREREWENPLKYDKLYVENSVKKKMMSIFSGTTPYGAILKVRERAEEILKDFRLESFRKSAGVKLR
ncbi:MAG: hypothetical protein JXN64_07460 [Spirochaetes bacterium]|nr:hypothetical protein [Spirochaetota bacterium]